MPSKDNSPLIAHTYAMESFMHFVKSFSGQYHFCSFFLKPRNLFRGSCSSPIDVKPQTQVSEDAMPRSFNQSATIL